MKLHANLIKLYKVTVTIKVFNSPISIISINIGSNSSCNKMLFTFTNAVYKEYIFKE